MKSGAVLITFCVLFGGFFTAMISATFKSSQLSTEQRAQLVNKLRAAKLSAEPIVGTTHTAVSEPEGADLLSSCSSCSEFVDVLVAATRGKVSVPSDHQNDLETRAEICGSMEKEEHSAACESVAQMYGLENVDEFVSAAPDLLCEPLSSCDGVTSDDATRELDDVGDVLLGVDNSIQIRSDDDDDKKKKKGNDMASAMKLMMAHRMYSMLNMKLMQDQQMGQQLVHAMMSKLIAAQERNREIKQEYLHFMKQSYRNQPGNCDCCDACLPPKKGGKGKGRKGGRKGKKN